MMTLGVFVLVLVLGVVVAWCVGRVVDVLLGIRARQAELGQGEITNTSKQARSRTALPTQCSTLIVLGSGGHTMEMLKLLRAASEDSKPNKRLYPRHYVVAQTDAHSREKAVNFEQQQSTVSKGVHFHAISRSREVGQSYMTSVVSTLRALIDSFPLLLRTQPQLILVNGPGSCVPVCIAAFVLKVLGLNDATIVYVESICRVTTLSLSAKLLQWFVDTCVVRWPELGNGRCVAIPPSSLSSPTSTAAAAAL
ncbi:hypothetical protein PTSG_06745 [Salpingoeca rosetta]|uniref:UDP-N-acetylglucosamine transferase subunit ALG14 n=1 Tax=Salpingoeca rosetta (strain ATCC 50818 / BSB-021) TaxID=946362 RepID=F2UEN9_SALR5|nr:uncharacterized protein PTSG_06745 [Salpingoeca rosetta]EGD75089.1 hypothetical protein PTSG_06745 [Salpingoeca rosetta]|eukprot:XP_004992142.1 hypothetical protein PTSG_06745 [Salpingoeca rosetta]